MFGGFSTLKWPCFSCISWFAILNVTHYQVYEFFSGGYFIATTTQKVDWSQKWAAETGRLLEDAAEVGLFRRCGRRQTRATRCSSLACLDWVIKGVEVHNPQVRSGEVLMKLNAKWVVDWKIASKNVTCFANQLSWRVMYIYIVIVVLSCQWHVNALLINCKWSIAANIWKT